MNKKNPEVSRFINDLDKWNDEFEKLRTIILETGLEEAFKWEQPCYSYQGSNIILIHGFKEYCAILFFKGVLLKDPKKILIQQTENVQSSRQIRFANIQEIKDLEKTIKEYVIEAIKIEKSGAKVEFKKTSEYKMPDELQEKLSEDDAFRDAWERLTPGRQRGYILYFSAPKKSETRVSRIEKSIDRVFDGIGFNE